MIKSPLERAEVRRQVDEVLRTDADLEAFCLDHFPDVHRRFAKGMERTDKVNLLLSLVERVDILIVHSILAAPGRLRTPRPK